MGSQQRIPTRAPWLGYGDDSCERCATKPTLFLPNPFSPVLEKLLDFFSLGLPNLNLVNSNVVYLNPNSTTCAHRKQLSYLI